MKKFFLVLSFFLSIMVLKGDKYSGGEGTLENPFRIGTLKDLKVLSETPVDWNRNFIQIANIDAKEARSWDNGMGLKPIGDKDVHFSGNYDGQGYIINNILISRITADFVGFFGYVDSLSHIKNISLIKMNTKGQNMVGGLVGVNEGKLSGCITTGYTYGNKFIGGIAGINRGDINNCHNKVNVRGSDKYVGGLVGLSTGNIVNCYSRGNVTGFKIYVGGLIGAASKGKLTHSYSHSDVRGLSQVGGLIGNSHIDINSCYSKGSIVATDIYAGGLVGYQQVGKITNSYNHTNIKAKDQVGGIVGSSKSDIEFCYNVGNITATGGKYSGGLAGTTDGSIINSYWDKETSKQETSAGSSMFFGKTTKEMTEKDTYKDWDFNNFWKISSDNKGYPSLDWQSLEVLQGSGTIKDPYQITNTTDLEYLSSHQEIWDKHFVQSVDIYAIETKYWNDGKGFSAIGNKDFPFSGSYQGNGYRIINLYINNPLKDNLGFFGVTSASALLRYIFLSDLYVKGHNSVGGLVGLNKGEIISCHTKGVVLGNREVGGLIGSNTIGSLSRCYTNSRVSGDDSSIGGLIGANNGNVTRCYSKGSVTGIGSFIGGLIGYSGKNLTVGLSYSHSDTKGGSYVGGLIGYSKSMIDYCYSKGKVISSGSNIGGLIGFNDDGFVNNSYWDKEYSGVNISSGSSSSYGKRIWEMKTENTYSAWDFIYNWVLNSENDGYPSLRYQGFTVLNGSGTQQNPYQIRNLKDLHYLSLHQSIWDKYFIQISDINADKTKNWYGGKGFLSIGNKDELFSGSYDGQGYKINNLVINRPSEDFLGLFGHISESSILKNINLQDVDITGHNIVGGLLGSNSKGKIISCSSTGSIKGNKGLGGLIGSNNKGNIYSCYSISNVSGTNEFIGGLIGNSSGNVNSCYSKGKVVGGFRYVGGLLGATAYCSVKNCYSFADVKGKQQVGGLVGNSHSKIINCYSKGEVKCENKEYIGGLIGNKVLGEITNSYWDKETSGLSTSFGSDPIFGKKSAEMKLSSTYKEWNFISIWEINTEFNDGYPFLSWEQSREKQDNIFSDQENSLKSTSLYQNYPNPFNPKTTVSYVLSSKERVEISVYDVRGRLVDNLVNKLQDAGKYHISWNASRFSAGMYFIKMRAGFYHKNIKALLLK